MKERRQEQNKNYIRAIFLFVLVMIFALLAFFVLVQKDIDKNVERTLKDGVKTQSVHLETMLAEQFNYLEAISEYISSFEEIHGDMSMELIQSVANTSRLQNLAIIDSDGVAHFEDETTFDVSDREYFQKCIQGQIVLSDVLTNRFDGKEVVVLAVPVYYGNQVVGVLAGSFDADILKEFLFNNMYDEQGFFAVVTPDGDIVSIHGNMQNIQGISNNNFFELCISLSADAKDVSQLQANLASTSEGYVILGSWAETLCCSYTSLGYNQWRVVYVISKATAQADYAFIREYELVICGILLIAVVVLYIYVLRFNRRRQNALMKYANTDSLTNLRNKKNTEDQIHTWLVEQQDSHSGFQAFFIMDIDFFKEINDKYGHAVGDEVLKQIGQILKRQFRENDILGRIGGDEFAIFMKNVVTVEAIAAKAESVASAIRMLNISELKGKMITCSIGIAYAPTHGQSYMDLYKHADLALYDTKENGRNGYTIYADDNAMTNVAGLNYMHRAYMEINPLTGLLYNKAFFKAVDARLKHIKPDTYALVALDLEHFRLFNRNYGREEGDRLLQEVANVLKVVQEEHGSIAGYLNGDNFAILMPDKAELVQWIQNSISDRLQQWNSSVGFLPAIGIYRISDAEVSAVNMYDRATLAMGHVYGNYINRVCIYQADMEKAMDEELSLISEIQEGIAKDEFSFFVQPQCHVLDGQVHIVGAECLARWRRSDGEMVSPGRFISVLEKSGFIADLDRYMWKKVCQWLHDWIGNGKKPVPISVNVSKIDIYSMDVPTYFEKMVADYQLDPRWIQIEIPESACAKDDSHVYETIERLQKSGFFVMVDDFGSGYSSLNMLKSVSVNALKMDMQFLKIDVQKEKWGVGILESLIRMARQMDIPIIVEGIETKAQEAFLNNLGCHYVQGYKYYRPMPVDEFEKMIEDETCVDFGKLINSASE